MISRFFNRIKQAWARTARWIRTAVVRLQQRMSARRRAWQNYLAQRQVNRQQARLAKAQARAIWIRALGQTWTQLLGRLAFFWQLRRQARRQRKRVRRQARRMYFRRLRSNAARAWANVKAFAQRRVLSLRNFRQRIWLRLRRTSIRVRQAITRAFTRVRTTVRNRWTQFRQWMQRRLAQIFRVANATAIGSVLIVLFTILMLIGIAANNVWVWTIAPWGIILSARLRSFGRRQLLQRRNIPRMLFPRWSTVLVVGWLAFLTAYLLGK